MHSVNILAPAKINWTLDILSVDERGYHILDMLMQRITLYDTVKIKKQDEGISLKTNLKWLPNDERNTAYLSAKLFFEEANIHGGCEIYIKKAIPSGAGLAGGSADASAVLKGLNTLYDNPLNQKQLSALALKIGADVPFMLRSGLYRAQGIGEKLSKLSPAPEIPLLLVMTKRESASTKKVYSFFDTIGSNQKPNTDEFIIALQNADLEKMSALGGNVLTQSAITIAPSIEKNIERLKNTSAKFVSMTGSGSVVFGAFSTIEEAKQARKEFPDCWTCVCKSTPWGIRFKEDN